MEKIIFRRFYQGLIPALFLLFTFLVPEPTIAHIEALGAHSLFPCFFFKITGFECPGCGMTRSMIAFFSGDLTLSFYFNPMGPVLGFLCVSVWLASFFKVDFNFSEILKRVPRSYWRPALTVVLAWGVLRN